MTFLVSPSQRTLYPGFLELHSASTNHVALKLVVSQLATLEFGIFLKGGLSLIFVSAVQCLALKMLGK